ncbi:hypothetical protein GXP70_18875 [Paenibacillus lycopersici]|uniref:Uncharacterized protein n=1 Tax=Paenibacillus lycopersici TaxID=2704462 RepID=A0A6C0FXM6_9BACL|nr:hypothetical protein [Paenibacillus lycopersici]QHT61838.1 hypothetical protein GXP70_18875 [Paenibacillus lycopersici]
MAAKLVFWIAWARFACRQLMAAWFFGGEVGFLDCLGSFYSPAIGGRLVLGGEVGLLDCLGSFYSPAIGGRLVLGGEVGFLDCLGSFYSPAIGGRRFFGGEVGFLSRIDRKRTGALLDGGRLYACFLRRVLNISSTRRP